MKITFALLLLSFSFSEAFAKCNSNAIGYRNESGFGISFGGGSSSAGFYDKNTVNVPVSINGEQACFKKVNAFKMKSEKKKDKAEENSIVITPMKTEFEKIPSAHQKQYIFVEKNPQKLLTKFHVMSFICSGEVPLSIEATSDTVLKINMQPDSADVRVSHSFATGAAAENLNKGNKGKTSNAETFDFFSKLYMEKSQKELAVDQACCSDFKIPSIISDTSIHAFSGVERAIASSFTTMASNVPNGCSNAFAETMKNYQLENYETNDSLKGYKVKKKWFSDDLVFEW
nr:hypothetical protein BHI3_05840 [Bacteriovorax sp. HI3]